MRVESRHGSRYGLVLGILAALLAGVYANCASAQVDLSGTWQSISDQERLEGAVGPFPVNFAGVPVNAQGRAAALSYSAEQIEELHKQCEPFLAHYLVSGTFGGMKMTPVRDPVTARVIAWRIGGTVDRMPMMIWMDGRPAPPEQAAHSFSGFSVGSWHGGTLIVSTTHLNDGLLTRNGVPSSNQTTLTLFFARHGDLLTLTGVIRDPVYLAAPWTAAGIFGLNPNSTGDEDSMHCMPENTVAGLSDGYHSISELPGQNPDLRYMPNHYGIPLDAALGGVQTMLPQFSHELERQYKRPTAYCTQDCCNSRDPKMACKNVL